MKGDGFGYDLLEPIKDDCIRLGAVCRELRRDILPLRQQGTGVNQYFCFDCVREMNAALDAQGE